MLVQLDEGYCSQAHSHKFGPKQMTVPKDICIRYESLSWKQSTAYHIGSFENKCWGRGSAILDLACNT